MNTILRDLSIIYSMVHCCIMLLLLHESRYSKLKTTLYTLCAMAPFIALNAICFIVLGIETTARFMIITAVLPGLIFFFFMAKNRGFRFIFSFCLCDTVVCWVMTLTNLLDTVLGVESYIVMFSLRLIIFPVIEYLIVRFMREPYREFQNKIRSGWGLFSASAATFYVLIAVATTSPSVINERPHDFPTVVLILILMPVVYITIVYILFNQLRLSQLTEERQMLNMQIKMIQDRIQSASEHENRLRILRHDTKHRCILLKDYIAKEETDKAIDYLNTILADVSGTAVRRYCENNSVNAVVDYYDKQATERGIALDTYLALPEMLSIPETDIAVLLSNALDNAIHALEREEEKTVSVKAFAEDGKLYLEVKNPFCGSVHFDSELPVSEKEGHGYGTKSMVSVVKRHGGIYSFTLENGFFVFRCAI